MAKSASTKTQGRSTAGVGRAAPKASSQAKGAANRAAAGKEPAREKETAKEAAAGAQKRPRRGRPPKHETETPNIPGARIIKKYGNRRLYDHTLSRPVTMDQLAEAVRGGEDIRVLDGETGEDITKRVLVQIILEQQNRQQLELLPIEFLRQLIQLRSEPLARWVSQYLTAGAQWMTRQVSSSAGPAMRTIQESFESLFPWLRKSDGNPVVYEQTEGPAAPADQEDLVNTIEELQAQLADLTKRVNRR